MQIFHYARVASRFAPNTTAFWVAIFHDAMEDGWWPGWLARLAPQLAADVQALTRQPDITYASYIAGIAASGGVVSRVKRADLADNYARAPASLRRRYAKAMAVLAEA